MNYPVAILETFQFFIRMFVFELFLADNCIQKLNYNFQNKKKITTNFYFLKFLAIICTNNYVIYRS